MPVTHLYFDCNYEKCFEIYRTIDGHIRFSIKHELNQSDTLLDIDLDVEDISFLLDNLSIMYKDLLEHKKINE